MATVRLKDLARELQAAAWSSTQEVEEWAERARTLDMLDRLKLLSYVDGRGNRRARLEAFARSLEGAKDPRAFAPLFKAALKGDEPLRRTLQPLVIANHDVRQHEDVCKALKSSDALVRRFASQVLKEVGGKTALAWLARSIGDRGWDSRMEAMEVAMELGGHHSIQILEQILKSGKPPEQVRAVRLLGDPRYVKARRKSAAGVLGRALEHPNRAVVQAALAALPAIAGEEDFLDLVAGWLDGDDPRMQLAVIDVLSQYGASSRIIDEYDRLFRVGRTVVREKVLLSLEKVGTEEILPTLVAGLSDPLLTVRNQAQEVLARVGRSGRVEMSRMLLWLMRSTDVDVRRQAVELARQVGDEAGELWPRMLDMLRDEDWWVRERVVEVLVELAGDQLTRHVAGFLEDDSDVVRRYAVEVLMRIKDPRSLGVLVQCAQNDEDWWVRERAIECMGEVGDARVVPHIINLARQNAELLYTSVAALGKLGDRQSLPFLLSTLTLGDAEVSLEALGAIKRLGDPTVAAQLTPLLNDADHAVREATRDLLHLWKTRAGSDGSVTAQLASELTGLERLLWRMTEEGGDDLFLMSGQPPSMKKLNEIVRVSERAYTAQQVESTLRAILTPVQWDQLQELQDVDCSIEVRSMGLRFRANVYNQLSGLSAVFRRIDDSVMSFEELGLPAVVKGLADLRNGLILVGGPTGSGKSTTLAAIIDYINRSYGRHIITIEDPIERVHHHKTSLVNQREVGSHTVDFSSALRATLREDPDVILVGEMRDLETIHFAVTAAETGHLVLGTVHTVSADTTMDRLINAFPAGQQAQVRTMLASTLRAVICQQLVRKADGTGRLPAIEVMINNEAVANLIRKGASYQIPSMIVTGRESGMQSMDGELLRMWREGEIDAEETYVRAINKAEVEGFMKQDQEARKKAVKEEAARGEA